jgi:saccharopine dehydrogenase-like NADP-dependent oxidoreductase
MRVLALGGSGGMGRFAVRAAVTIPGVDSIVVADLQASSAQAFAATLPGKATGIGLDVMDSSALRAAMREVDVVLNTTGPFFKLAVPILQTAIESGCHYLDICDDWEPTLEMFAMDAAAREAGITAVIGLGASPGLSNLLGLAAMRELDSVQELYTGWDMAGAVPEDESSQDGVNAAMVHAIQQLTGVVRVQREGAVEMARPLDTVEIDYPGIGRRAAYIFGHPEAVTFPHHYPEIRTSLNLAHGVEGHVWVLKVLRGLVERGWLSMSRGAALLGWLEGLAGGGSTEPVLSADRLPGIYGLAVGTREGVPASVAVTLGDIGEVGMGFVTGVPLACGLELLLKGSLVQRGVFAPESGAIDPHEFFRVLSTKEGADGSGSAPESDILLVTRSWDPDARKSYQAAIAAARLQLEARQAPAG